MQYKFTPNYEQDNNMIIQNMNKNVFEWHCGFRRYLIKPIFYSEIPFCSDKRKLQKCLEKDKFYIMIAYMRI